MNIFSWNVNGLRAVSEKGFFDFIDEKSPDILCIQETKIQPEKLTDKLKDIKDYYSNFSYAEKKGYSGVATYSKLKPISVKHGIGIEKFDSEGRILITEFEKFILFNVYFPNGQRDEERLNYKMEFYDAILDYLNELKDSGKKLIICGDYNTAHNDIDIKNAKANSNRSGFLPVERAWIDKFIDNGYGDIFRIMHPLEIKYSWWSYRFKARERNAGWRIDYFFVTDNLVDNIEKSEILNEIKGSDHCPIEITVKL
ncbi:MAG: exodeoxyribonuclease III [Clostridium sp.]|nr:exodeoxyribonuclease III [Clostridium sp.]